MKTIIQEIVETFKQRIEEFVSQEGTERYLLDEIESFCMKEVKDTGLRLAQAMYEMLDQSILENKTYRKEEGLVVERKNNSRTVLTQMGYLQYERTYYQRKDGTYCFPVDQVAGLEGRERISLNLSKKLVSEALKESYARASEHVTEGEVSPQTVMNCIRNSTAVYPEEAENKRHVSVLHIDADEDHVSLQNGQNVIVPLITVYEGIKAKGKRHFCINVNSHPFYRKKSSDIWNTVLSRIEAEYDLTNTKVYIHGDGASWIKEGLEWFSDCVYVLDRYHLNKYIKQALVDQKGHERGTYQKELKKALYEKDDVRVSEIHYELVLKNPDKEETISNAIHYLMDNIDAISIRKEDVESMNGGATEPHISHILSSRLSSRPMGWSDNTLKKMVPLLGSCGFKIDKKKVEVSEKLEEICKEVTCKMKSKPKNTAGLIHPDHFVDATNKLGPYRTIIKAYGRLF